LFAREGLLEFLRKECEERGATIFYATHIFDYLADWATHMLFFSKAKVARCCSMAELHEYHDLVAKKTKVPLYMLMRDWVCKEYEALAPMDPRSGAPEVPEPKGAVLETNGLSYSYLGGSPQLSDVSFTFGRGARILVVGANGAGKSTLLSVLGGKRMVPRGLASVMGKDCFNEPTGDVVMYCGDWWRSKSYTNLSFREILGADVADSPRAVHLAKVLQVDMEWKVHAVSDGQRRRCQLLEILATPRPVYLMDEITSDLDLFAREGILNFLRAECELRGCTIFYCTHIFDHLEDWPTHMLHLSKGKVVQQCAMTELDEYNRLCREGDSTPLYTLIRGWVYKEYEDAAGAKPWRKLDSSLDGRIPNLGLAGPIMAATSG